MKPCRSVEHTRNKIELVPIPSGKFIMGSLMMKKVVAMMSPQHEIAIEPFWMGKTEITWDVYEVWMSDIDIQIRNVTVQRMNEISTDHDNLQADRTVYRYDFWNGETGLSRDQHDTACGPNLL